MILYIHGFRTTKNSHTSQILKQYFKKDIIISEHPVNPKDAIKYLENIIETHNITAIIASSLGGYYATYLATKYNLKAVLINPSVNPYRTTKTYLGKNTTQDGVEFFWKKKHLKQLVKYKVKQKELQSKKFYLLLQKGDPILNFKVAKKRYPKAKKTIEKGGTHRFKNLKRHLKAVSSFIKK